MGENEHDGAGARGCGADAEPADMAGLDPPHQRRPAEVGLLMYRKVGGGACGDRLEVLLGRSASVAGGEEVWYCARGPVTDTREGGGGWCAEVALAVQDEAGWGARELKPFAPGALRARMQFGAFDTPCGSDTARLARIHFVAVPPAQGRPLELDARANARWFDVNALLADRPVVLDSVTAAAAQQLRMEEVLAAAIPGSTGASAMWHLADSVRVHTVPTMPRRLALQQHTTLALAADCATGKSRRIRQCIQSVLKPGSRVIALCVRIIHAHDLHAQLKPFGFKCYRDPEFRGGGDGSAGGAGLDTPSGLLQKTKRLVISLESLCRLQSLQHTLRDVTTYGMVILDECRSLCSILDSSTLEKNDPEASIRILSALVRHTPYVIAADADFDFDGACMGLLQGIAPNRPVRKLVVEEHRLRRRLQCHFTSLKGQKEHFFHHTIGGALREPRPGRRLAVACGSKADAKTVATMCAALRVPFSLYTGDTSDKVKERDFRDIDAAWADKRAVIFTSSLTVGVDPRKTVFTDLFLVTSRSGSTLRDLFQGLCRFNRMPAQLDTELVVQCLIDDISPAMLKVLALSQRRGVGSKRLRRTTGAEEEQQEGGVADDGAQVVLEPYTYTDALGKVRRHTEHKLQHLAQALQLAGIPVMLLAVADRWVDRVRAWSVYERTLQTLRGHHFELVQKLAAMRGWQVEAGTQCPPREAEQGALLPVLTCADDVVLMTDDAKFEHIRRLVLEQDHGSDALFFQTGAYGLAARSKRGDPLGSEDKALVAVYHVMKNYGTFDIIADGSIAFRKLVFGRSTVELHAVAMTRQRWQDLLWADAARCLNVVDSFEEGGGSTRTLPVNYDQMLSLKLQTLRALCRLLGIQQDLPCAETVVLAKEWVDRANRWDPAKADGCCGGKRASDADLERHLFRLSSQLSKCSVKRGSSLALHLRALFRKFGIRVTSKTSRPRCNGGTADGTAGVGRKRVVVELALVSDPTVARLAKEFHLYDACSSTYVRAVDWAAHVEERDARCRMQQPLDGSAPFASFSEAALASAHPQSSEMVERISKAGLERLLADAVPSEQSMVQEIARLAQPGEHPQHLCVHVCYHKTGTYGRDIPSYPSLGLASKRIRGWLAAGIYEDLDIVNCHPAILSNVARQVGLAVPEIDKYIASRDAVLEELSGYYGGCSTQAAKQLVLVVMNMGGVAGWVKQQELDDLHSRFAPKCAQRMVGSGGEGRPETLAWLERFRMGKQVRQKVRAQGDHPLVRQLRANVKALRAAMLATYPHVLQETQRRVAEEVGGSPGEVERKAFSRCLFHVESVLLEAIIASLTRRGWRADAKCYDGCLVRINETLGLLENQPGVCRAIAEDVARDTGFKIDLKVKPLARKAPPISRRRVPQRT